MKFGLHKKAGGEILGGLAGLLARPFVSAARSKGLQQGVTRGITRYVNAPIERAMHGSGAHKGISWLAGQGARDIPGTPRVFMKSRNPVERQVFGNQVADAATNMIAHHPETLPMQFVPVPGMTPGWLAAKAGMRRALGVQPMTTRMAMIAQRGPRATTQMDAVTPKLASIEKDEFYKFAQVAPYQQETQWSCSAACLKAVLAHHGKEISEEQAVSLIGARPGRGAEVSEIAEAARSIGFDAFHYLFDSIEQAKKLLDKDIPIICDIQSFKHPGKGHYVVMVSADMANVILMDPNTEGNQRTIPREEMEDRWWDHEMEPPHNLMTRWGIVVLPPEEGTSL